MWCTRCQPSPPRTDRHRPVLAPLMLGFAQYSINDLMFAKRRALP